MTGRILLLLATGYASLGCARAGRTATLIGHVVAAHMGPSRVEVFLERSLIDRYRNRATIETSFTVDAVHRMVNPAAFDGDIHIAGRSPDLGFRLVAEIKNAGSEGEAIAVLREAESSRQPVAMTGGWRFWPEHAIGFPHRQDEPMAPLTNANPDHVFEIHPVLQVGDLDLRRTLRPVRGYRPYSAPRSFGLYERAEITLRARPGRIRVTIPAGLYNDVHFLLDLRDRTVENLSDGTVLTGRVLDLEGNVLIESVRFIVIRGTPPEAQLLENPPTEPVRVWGLPRISLAGLWRLLEEAGADTAPRTVKLPYEVVIVGVYPAEER